MEVKEGYKNTEIGLIPDEWICDELRMFLSYISYGFTNPMPTVNDGIYMITANDINEGKLKVETARKTSKFAYDNFLTDKSRPKKNDTLLTKDGTLGRLAIVGKEQICINQSVAVLRPNTKINPLFLKLLLEGNKYQKTMILNAGGSTIKHIYITVVDKMKIGLPAEIMEQTAIAEVLSDTDNLIQAIEKQIAKKRNIKQGAMQKLLQPKEGWVEQSIFQLADNRKEQFDDGDWIESEHITDKGIRLIQTGNIGIGIFIEKDNRKYIYQESFEKLGCKELIVGDLLICRLAEPAGRACVFPSIGEEKVITSVDVTIFRPKEEIANRQFLNQIFSTRIWFNSISDLCGGTTHKRISRGALGRIKILLPDIEEQTRIATILSDMDNEITALETKLKKYKMLKLGMMQNLLTGKIRLIKS